MEKCLLRQCLKFFSLGLTALLTLLAFKAEAQSYCTPSPAGNNNYIVGVSTSGASSDFTRTSGDESYTDNTASHSATVTAGSTFTVTVDACGTGGTWCSQSYAKIWIDWNDDGDFDDAGEEVYYYEPYPITSGTYSFVASITVPIDAVIGDLRMRIYTDWHQAPSSGYTAIAPCASTSWGEVEDYGIHVMATTPCADLVIDAGALVAPTSVCPGQSFSIANPTIVVGMGAVVAWEMRSPAGSGPWVPITGVSTFGYNVSAGIEEETEYRSYVVCAAGGTSDTTAPVTIGLNPGSDCYCEPSPSGYDSYISMASTTGGITDFSRSSGNEFYSDLTATHEVSQVQGNEITFTINTYGSPAYCKIWVDWNQDGDFTDAGEEVYVYEPYPTEPGASSFTGVITVPYSATPGPTRMRIYTDYYLSAWYGYVEIDPCVSTSWGEVEDYSFVVVEALPCTDAEAGTISGVSAICSSEPFSLLVTGSTAAAGLTRYWQSRPEGTSTWTTIAGASSSMLSVSAGITEAMEYRAIITCDDEGLSDTTPVHLVSMSPAVDCYCEPSPAGGNNYITSAATTGGVTNFSRSSGNELYSDLTATHEVSQTQGLSVNFSLTTYGSPSYCKIWVDWNQDGDFDDAGEEVYVFEPYPMTSGASSFSGTIEVPYYALPGATRMRIYTDWYYAPYYDYPEIAPCASTDWGEVEDYSFVVISSIPCDDAVAGTITGPTSECAGEPFNLSLSGYTMAAGLSITWQSRPESSTTWTTIAGEIGSSLSVSSGISEPTEYRAFVVCTDLGLSDTTPVYLVGLSPGVDCYCEPSPAGGNNYITSASTTGGVTNFSRSSANEFFTDLTATHVVSQTQGLSIDFNVTTYGSPSYCKIWVDWNQDGNFTGSDELVYLFEPYPATSGASTFSGTITVPEDALPGNTRMRIYTDWYYAPYSGYTEIEPCSSTDWGEVEDYGFLVISSCSPSPSAAATGPGPICAGDTLNLFASSDIGTTYSWTGPAGFTSTDQNPVITATTAAMSGDYIVTVTEPSNGCTRTDTVNVVINPSPSAITLSPSEVDICPGSSFSITATGGSGGTFVWTPIGGTTSGTGGSVYTVSPTSSLTQYTASVTNTYGCVAHSDTTTIRVNPIPSGLVGVSPTTCATSNGYITLTGLITGESYTVSYIRDGVPFVSDTITSVFNTVTVTGLGAGSYTAIHVTRVSTGCVSTNMFATTLSSPSPPPFLIDSYDDPIACGSATGTITFAGMTASTSFTLHYKKDGVEVSPIPFTSSATGTYTLIGLTAGEYTDIYITRVSSSCTSASLAQTLVSPMAPTITIVDSQDPSGCAATDGYITFDGLDPLELYTIDYIIDGVPMMHSDFADASGQATLSGLGSGNYTNIVVTNSASCGAAPLNIELFDASASALVVSPTSVQDCAGSMHTITISGGELTGASTTYSISPIDHLYLDVDATIPYAGESVTTVYAQPDSSISYTITATSGSCVTTASADILVLTPDNTVQLATTAHNGLALSVACEEDGWTYYTDPTDPDMPFLIGILWGTGNEAAQSAAIPTLQVDPDWYAATDEASSMATFVMRRYWNVDLGTATLVNPVSIRFFYDVAEKNAADSAALAFAAAYGGEVEPSTWFKLEGELFSTSTSLIDEDRVHNAIPLVDVSSGATLNGVTYAQFDGISSFSGGGYASGVGPGTPLQTKLGQFTAQAKEGYNQLDWTSLAEQKGDFFRLHKSLDGQNFSLLTQIEAKGEPSRYTYRDMYPQQGQHFYQLSMYSQDGSKVTSDIIVLDIAQDDNKQISVYPNPTSDEVVLQVHGQMAANAKVVLTDLAGRVLAEYQQFEQNALRIDMKPYAQGMYFIRYQDDQYSHTVKVTRQ